MPNRIRSRLFVVLAIAIAAGLLWTFAGAKDHAYIPLKDNGKRVAAQSPAVRPAAPSALDQLFPSSHGPLQIPDGPNGVLIDSMIITENVPIHDLDIQVDISHNWVRDLTIILRHVPQSGAPASAMLLDLYPAGFTVNLTGTWFSDEAGEWILRGQPPFTGDYRPMQPLSVFDGHNTAGIWYLEFRDRFHVDSGVVNSWTLEVDHVDMLSGVVMTDRADADSIPHAFVELLDTIPITDSTYTINVIQQLYTRGTGEFAIPRLPAGDYHARLTHPYADSLAIANFNVAPGTEVEWLMHSDHWFEVANISTVLEIRDATVNAPALLPISFTEAMDVLDVDISLDITHTYIGDLSMILENGEGQDMDLVTFNENTSGDNLLDCRFDDEAELDISHGDAPYTGSWLPESPLSYFDNKLSAGPWALTITDHSEGDFGTLDRAELTIVYNKVGTITGQITTGRGVPVPVVGVHVSIVDANISDCTDQDGFFLLSKVPIGVQVVEFNHQLYRFGQAWPDVTFGDTTVTDVTLTRAYAAATVFTASDPFEIVDADTVFGETDTTIVPTPVFGTLQVDNANLIADLNVILNISHTYIGDLKISLFSPDSTEVILTTNRSLGSSRNESFVDTRFDDESCDNWWTIAPDSGFTGTWKPVDSLSIYDGISSAGPWTLKIVDHVPGDAGSVDSWSLEFLFDDDLLDAPPAAFTTPENFAFHGNYPNPFNPSTTFAFDLNRAAPVKLIVYNLLGQQVAMLLDKQLEAGTHKLTFEASGLASGVYLARLSTPDHAQTKKIVLLR